MFWETYDCGRDGSAPGDKGVKCTAKWKPYENLGEGGRYQKGEYEFQTSARLHQTIAQVTFGRADQYILKAMVSTGVT